RSSGGSTAAATGAVAVTGGAVAVTGGAVAVTGGAVAVTGSAVAVTGAAATVVTGAATGTAPTPDAGVGPVAAAAGDAGPDTRATTQMATRMRCGANIDAGAFRKRSRQAT